MKALSFASRKVDIPSVCFTRNFPEPQNPRFIIESGFKSRAGYNGARTVYKILTEFMQQKQMKMLEVMKR